MLEAGNLVAATAPVGSSKNNAPIKAHTNSSSNDNSANKSAALPSRKNSKAAASAVAVEVVTAPPPPVVDTAAVVPGGSLDSPDVDAEILSQAPIHKATQERNLSEVRSLVEAGGRGVLEERDSFGLTPFMKASLCADLEMVRFLLESGADVKATDTEGRGALHYAALNVNPYIISLLVQEGGLDVNGVDGSQRTAVYIAASNGKVEAVRELMAMGADPTITDEQGCTPADVVCQRTSGHKPRDAILDLLRAKKQQRESGSPPRPKARHGAKEMGPEQSKAEQQQAAEEEEEMEGELGVLGQHVSQAAALLDKLRLDFSAVGKLRASALQQLEDGHLERFLTAKDERLHAILTQTAQDPDPEAPLLAGLEQLAEAKAAFDSAQDKVRGLCRSVPEEHMEANSVLAHHPALAQAVAHRDEARDALHQGLVSFLELCRAKRLEAATAETEALVQELTTLVGAQVTDYVDVSAVCHRCLAHLKDWEKQVRRQVEEEGAATTSARDALAKALLSTVSLLDAPPAHAPRSSSQPPPHAAPPAPSSSSSVSSSPPLEEVLKDFAIQVSHESRALRGLTTGSAVRPPFPRDTLALACRIVRLHLLQRLHKLQHVASRLPFWERVRRVLSPWVGKSSAAVSGEFLSGNAKTREALLKVEDEIIDKNYEKAKIHNAQRRKGASNARAHEAKANQEALDELRGEKRAAARARREFLLLWLKHKEEHVPELPLARADLLGAHHHAMPQLSVLDPVAKLFTPGRSFADYVPIANGGPKGAIRREVHVAEYDGEPCLVKVFAGLDGPPLQAFMRDLALRFKLQLCLTVAGAWGLVVIVVGQSCDAPVVPVEAAFTEDEHRGTGYLHLRHFQHDLVSWAATASAHGGVPLEHVLSAFRRVLEVVDALHGLGVVHGALREAAFLLDVADDGGPLPRLADVEGGASAMLLVPEGHGQQQAGPAAAGAVTSPTMPLEYLAPELKDGRGSHPTRETDLYSCGVLLRHLLDQAAAPLKQEDHASSSAEAAKALAAMSASLCDPDPAKRPSAAHALAALQPSATNNGPMAPAA